MACGQSAGLINSVKPAGEIVRDVMNEAQAVLESRLGGASRRAQSQAA